MPLRGDPHGGGGDLSGAAADKDVGRRCEIVGWQRFHALARRLARRVRESGYRPDIIVAIGRGGYLPARVLSDFLGQARFAGFGVEHYRDIRQRAAARISQPLAADVRGLRVLLVDDVSDSGDTFAVALAHLRAAGPAEVRTAVLHHKLSCPYRPDYYAGCIRKWRWIVYPWAIAEDVGALVRALVPPPADADEAARRLAAAHGIRLRRDLLQDVLAAAVQAGA